MVHLLCGKEKCEQDQLFVNLMHPQLGSIRLMNQEIGRGDEKEKGRRGDDRVKMESQARLSLFLAKRLVKKI